MKRSLSLIVALLLTLTVVLTGCGRSGTPKAGDKSEFVFGAVFDITGPSSSLGITERDSAQMYVDQLNAKGGINGHKVKLIVYDNKSTESESALAIKKLIEQDKVLAVIGASSSGPSMAMIPIAQEKKVPMVSAAASVKIIEPVADRQWVFKTAQNDALVAAKVVRYLKAKNYKKVAFMLVNSTFGESGLDEFKKAADKEGTTIVTTQKFEATDTNMTAQGTKVKEANPDVVIVWATPPSASNVAKSIKQVGLTIPQIQSHGIGNMTFIDQAGDAANGVVFPIGKLLVAEGLPDSDPQKAVLTQYVKDYEAKYGPRSTFGGYGLDAIAMVATALEKCGDNPTPQAIRDQLEKITDFKGISGVFNMSAQDHNGLQENALVMVKIQDGKWTFLQN
jgi:branched-chain amino acid transport system substrate-binding protein